MENDGAMRTSPVLAPPAVAAPAARLSLEPTRSRQRMLDGAWWPRSYDSEKELSALLAALLASAVSVTRIGLKRGAWDSEPQSVAFDGHVARLYWHGPQDIHAISVTVDGLRRLDILLVPPAPSFTETLTALSTGRDETTCPRPDQPTAPRITTLETPWRSTRSQDRR